MWISKAFAATDQAVELDALADAPSATEAFMLNMGMVGVLVILFYVLLIMPQQRRFKEHAKMLDDLKKGDRVVTGGGLIGKIDSISADGTEVVIEISKDVKVTALRSMIQSKNEPALKSANDDKKSAAAKAPEAGKSAPAKKAAKKDSKKK